MTSFGVILRKHQGVGPGFDFLRLFLALSVVLWHAYLVTHTHLEGVEFRRGPVGLLVYFIVPAFFALSGFLVAGSMIRVGNLKVFLAFRALRIAPALVAEIVLSALVLGPLVTDLRLGDYYSGSEFIGYFTNIIGLMKYRLPGVFIDNPFPRTVNSQLWTIPSELHCYLLMSLLILCRISQKKTFLLFLFLAASVGISVLNALGHRRFPTLDSQDLLILYFLSGVVFYLWKDFVPSNPLLAIFSIGLFVAAFYIPIELRPIIAPIPVAYATIYLGMQRLPRVPILMGGDYSYGIYLYSFPLQQLVVWGFPALRQWYLNFVLAAPLAIGFAMISWHVLEKPALGLRKRLAPKAVVPRPVLDEAAAPSPSV